MDLRSARWLRNAVLPLVVPLCGFGWMSPSLAHAVPLLQSDYQSYTIGPGPYGVTCGDLNRDGFDDIATLDRDGVALSFARGDGTFEASRRFPTPAGLLGLTTLHGKKHGPDRLALVLRSPENGALEAYVYDDVSGPRALAPEVVTFGGAAQNLVTGDVDGDGVIDLVAADGADPRVWVAYGRRSGKFDAPVPYGAAFPTLLVLVGDVNGDGRADLITSGLQAFALAVLPNHGGRTFGTPIRSFASAELGHLAVGDFNGDGHADLLTAPAIFSDGTFRTYYGNASGYLTLHAATQGDLVPSAVLVEDFNADGRSDVLFARRLSLFLSGEDTFLPPDNLNAGNLWVENVATGDFDGDQNLDLAVVDGVSGIFCIDGAHDDTQVSLHVWRGIGDGTFAAAPSYAYPWANIYARPLLVDLDADGVPDLAVGTAGDGSRGVRTWRGHPDGSFDAPVGITLEANVVALAAADFDGDGRPELLASLLGSQTPVVLLKLRPDRGLAVRADASGVTFARRMAVADFDGDGHPDVALTNVTGSSVQVLLARPGFGNWQVSSFPARGPAGELAAADLDRDGRVDLVVGYEPYYSLRPVLRMFRGMGNGSFTFADSLAVPLPAVSVRCIDATGDGRPELVLSLSPLGCFGNNSVVRIVPNLGGSFCLGEPSGFCFGAPADVFMEPGPQDATLADLTGDGVLDLVAISANERVGVRPGLGNGQFGELSRFGIRGLRPAPLLVADLDGDGRQDVLVGDPNGVRVLRNQGAAVRRIDHSTARPDALVGDVSPPTVTPDARLVALPNPVSRHGAIRLALDLPRAESDVDIGVYDVSGRRVAQLASGAMDAGAHRIPWTGAGRAADPVPGLYFVRARLGGERTLVTRILVLP